MTKKVPQKNKVQEPKAQPKVQAPKGRNKPVQGNALGHTVPEDQSPKGAGQTMPQVSEQTQGYDDLGNA